MPGHHPVRVVCRREIARWEGGSEDHSAGKVWSCGVNVVEQEHGNGKVPLTPLYFLYLRAESEFLVLMYYSGIELSSIVLMAQIRCTAEEVRCTRSVLSSTLGRNMTFSFSCTIQVQTSSIVLMAQIRYTAEEVRCTRSAPSSTVPDGGTGLSRFHVLFEYRPL